jgi:RNA polymerase sigma-70 factor (ECF subfamily)
MRALVVRYHGRLFGFFVGQIGDRDPSEDLVQEVFIRLWRYRDRYDPERPFLPWVFRIARNLLNDFGRGPVKVALDRDLPAHGPDPEEAFQKSLEADSVRKAVLTLPANQRDALLLSRWSGMTYREVGEALECSEGAVKVRVYRAMETLRTLLADVEEDKS